MDIYPKNLQRRQEVLAEFESRLPLFLTTSSASVAALDTAKLIADAKHQYESRVAYYHTWSHALTVAFNALNLASRIMPLTLTSEMKAQIVLAGLFHDVVHSNNTPQDERESCAYLSSMLGGTAPLALGMIEATAHHFKPLPAHLASEINELFLDADLSGLGDSDKHEFLRQNDGVAKETAWYGDVSDEDLRAGRYNFIDFAKKALSAGFVYRTKVARHAWQFQAESNLEMYHRELGKVSGALVVEKHTTAV